MTIKRRKAVKISIWVLCCLFVLLNAFAAIHAWKLTHFYKVEGHPKAPEQLSIGEKLTILFTGVKTPKSIIKQLPTFNYDTVTFTTTDGLKIEGWHATHDTAKGAVALFHGHIASKSAVLVEAEAFYKLGYNVLLIDFRGHGNSDGDYCTIGYKEAEDVKLAYDFLKGQGNKNVVLWGISMGAAAITSAFDKYDIEPNAVILELPFGSLYKAVEARVHQMGLPALPIVPALTFWGGAENGFNAFTFSPQNYSKKIGCPVLLQAGKLDNRVSLEEIEGIFVNLQTENKRKVVYDNSGHQSLLKNEPEKWNTEVVKFLEAVRTF